MEATSGWLVPILSEISEDRTRVILPVIDNINSKTFEYSKVENDRMRSGLNWKLRHIWLEPDPRGGVIAGDDNERIDPFPSPTMIGCAFGIDREYFFKVGSYDQGMLIWGGENVEMSIRIWRCGGSLMVVPCSHVGHIYRSVNPALFHNFFPDCPGARYTVFNFSVFTVGFKPFRSLFVSTQISLITNKNYRWNYCFVCRRNQ